MATKVLNSARARPIAARNLHPRLRFDGREVIRALRVLDAHYERVVGAPAPASTGELSLAFLTDRELARLHEEFMGDPSPTDVITFPENAELGSPAEICVSVDAARRRGGAFSEELTLYIVHGWLHLAGYDDRDPGSRRAMRRAEARAMKTLRATGAMPRFAVLKRGAFLPRF